MNINEMNFDEILNDAGIDDNQEEKMPTIEELQSQLEKEKSEKQQLKQSNEKMSTDYRKLRSNYDTVKDRYGKTIGFVEGTGVGKYDPETGQIIKIEKSIDQQQEKAPDFTSIEKNLSKEFKALDRKLSKGDIDQSEYLDEVNELREQQNAIAQQRIEYASRKAQAKPQEQQKQVEPEKHQDFEPRHSENNQDEYAKIAEQNPEISDDDSPLWKEMQKVFNSNPNHFAKGNPGNGAGDPSIYKELINQASRNLMSGKSDIYQTPRNHGYQERKQSKSYLTQDDTKALISQGFSDRKLLSDINQSIGGWIESGGRDGVTMDF